MSNITLRLQFTRLKQPLKYATLYCTTHTSLMHIKKLHTRQVHGRPNIHYCSVLLHVRACLHEGGGPQVGEVTFGGLPHLTCKRDHIKMRDYMDRRVTPPKRVTSPTWGTSPPCKQALNRAPGVR